ncbi:hypothetical protein NQ176_g3454 [Zarea fungicola]|uniref:Uncharacterized protein n=1 Tax=Zarea fungicola TaxID=93591 RepID=A0ACC1NIC7_9HYPO|nr:hypothetical protein NQ176_g3454 [Lecanicillium fungicola]
MFERMTTPALVATAPNSGFKKASLQLTPLHDNEALVRISAVGVCHAEVSILNGTIPSAFPRVLGHEGAGTIVSVGRLVPAELNVGAKVLLSFAYCGQCSNCNDEHPAYCEENTQLVWEGRRADGGTAYFMDGKDKIRGGFFGQSSFSKYAIVHSSTMIKVPDDTDLGLMAPLGCGVQTGVGTVLNCLKVKRGMSIAVFGAGSVGLSAIMAAKFQGAGVIIAIDIDEGRLRLAQEIGATHAIRGGNNDEVVRKITEICNGRGVQRAMDATGNIGVIEAMVKSLMVRGQAALVGAPAVGKTASIEIISFLNGGKELIGAVEGDCFPPKVDLWTQHAACTGSC